MRERLPRVGDVAQSRTRCQAFVQRNPRVVPAFALQAPIQRSRTKALINVVVRFSDFAPTVADTDLKERWLRTVLF